MTFKPSNTHEKYQSRDYDEDSIGNFESGKFIQSRSLEVDADILADKQNADRRSYKYQQTTDSNFDNDETFSKQRSLGNKANYNYQTFEEKDKENVIDKKMSFANSRSLRFPIVDEVDSRQVTQVADRNKFRPGNSRRQLQRDGQREEVIRKLKSFLLPR